MNTEDIMVSVNMSTYNHEKYIGEAIESILNQIVNFKYEIVIGDDCSTDNTREIILKYKNKYPDIITTVFHKKNVGPTKNGYIIRQNCVGKYIADLEGDDFWNDCNKLQKQVDFLESHPEFIGVTHSCNVKTDNEKMRIKVEKVYKCKDKNVFTFEDFKKVRFPGHTCTRIYRNIFKDKAIDYSICYKADKNTGDRTLNMLLLAQGDIYQMEEAMSTYRLVLKKGASNINSLYLGKNMLWHDWQYERYIDDYCEKTFNMCFLNDESLAEYWLSSLKRYILNRRLEDINIFKKFNSEIKKYPSSIKYIPKLLLKKIISI